MAEKQNQKIYTIENNIENLTSLDFQPMVLFSYPSIAHLAYNNCTHHKQILSIPGEICSQKGDVLVHRMNFQL